MSAPERPTIHDVAAVAGVSHQTVSRVLNCPETVRSSTRTRVLAVISHLGYERSPDAVRLAQRPRR
ncbi:LacI family DNA-binding transcriptional regulator [Curtobacterium citreum]|uniref:LacI family DNA-binding transcriptional regulator n=1 Tax=Curtobacterium citreum TaxID=2036 RepID=UPI0035A967A7